MKRMPIEQSFETEITIPVKIYYIVDGGYPQTWDEPGEPPSAEITCVKMISGKELIPIPIDDIEGDFDLESEALEAAIQESQDRDIDHAEMKMAEKKYGF